VARGTVSGPGPVSFPFFSRRGLSPLHHFPVTTLPLSLLLSNRELGSAFHVDPWFPSWEGRVFSLPPFVEVAFLLVVGRPLSGPGCVVLLPIAGVILVRSVFDEGSFPPKSFFSLARLLNTGPRMALTGVGLPPPVFLCFLCMGVCFFFWRLCFNFFALVLSSGGPASLPPLRIEPGNESLSPFPLVVRNSFLSGYLFFLFLSLLGDLYFLPPLPVPSELCRVPQTP